MSESLSILFKRVDPFNGIVNSYEWVAPNGRCFDIDEEDKLDGSPAFYVEERIPSGSFCFGQNPDGRYIVDNDSDLSLSLQDMLEDKNVSPSEVYQFLNDSAIARDHINFTSVYMGEFATLEEVREAILDVYLSDQWVGVKGGSENYDLADDDLCASSNESSAGSLQHPKIDFLKQPWEIIELKDSIADPLSEPYSKSNSLQFPNNS